MRLMGFTFPASNRYYAIDLTRIYRIEAGVPIHPMPWAVPELLGICRIREWIVPVIHLRQLLHDTGVSRAEVVIVYVEGDRMVAFPVAGVTGSFGRNEIRKVVRQTQSPERPFLLHTTLGVFHFVDMKYILVQRLQPLWQT